MSCWEVPASGRYSSLQKSDSATISRGSWPASTVWLNGHAVEPDTTVADDDEVAILPPVSGG